MMAASEAEMARAESESAEEPTAQAPTDERSEAEAEVEAEASDGETEAADAFALGAAVMESAEADAAGTDAERFQAPAEMLEADDDDATGDIALARLAADEDAAPEAGENPALDAEMAALLASLAAAPAMDAAEPAATLPSEPVEGETVLELPAVLDLTAAAALHATLLAHRGTPLALDAGAVKRLGGQCLQLLISANRTWAADGVPLRIAATSDAFERDLGLMGLSCDELLQREAA
jgi:anti-anti-sigma regulatory factor